MLSISITYIKGEYETLPQLAGCLHPNRRTREPLSTYTS